MELTCQSELEWWFVLEELEFESLLLLKGTLLPTKMLIIIQDSF